ncbi:MAG: hypothetical protein ABIQ64_01415 [Candidatus Saccharimonadales bacterium]
MSIDTVQREISPSEVDALVHGPSPESKIHDATSEALVGARATRQELFYNATLRVFVPAGDSVGTTSTDKQEFHGPIYASMYDRAVEGK